jgi:hypothetical protein
MTVVPSAHTLPYRPNPGEWRLSPTACQGFRRIPVPDACSRRPHGDPRVSLTGAGCRAALTTRRTLVDFELRGHGAATGRTATRLAGRAGYCRRAAAREAVQPEVLGPCPRDQPLLRWRIRKQVEAAGSPGALAASSARGGALRLGFTAGAAPEGCDRRRRLCCRVDGLAGEGHG